MSNTQADQAAVFATAGNTVEITRTSTVRRLIATKTQHKLVLADERGKSMIYVIDAAAFIREHEAEYGQSEDPLVQQARVAEALFRAVLDGKTFRVLSQHVVPPALTA